MKRFKKILLVFDPKAGGETLLERALILAKRNQAQLTVVTVIVSKPRDAHLTTEVIPARNVHQLDTEAELKQFISSVQQDRDQRVDTRVLIGTAFEEIIRIVMLEGYDLVMMTAEQRGGLKTWMVGKTSLHLMRKCPCPVWVMKPNANDRFTRILAAMEMDPDSVDQEKCALNTSIMDFAASLARSEGCELHVAHVWSMFAERLLRSPRARVSQDQVDEWVREERDKHKRQLDILLGKDVLENPNLHVHLLKGNPDTLLSELARQEQIDLMVMGSACRTGFERFLNGNMSEKVLQEVDCSVLTVKPNDFVSPVTL